jgi:programmed cell death protein 5
MSGDDLGEEELEQLRRRRLTELQRAASEEERRAEAHQQVEAQKQAILKRILTTEARQRLTNIRMVKPEFADQVELQLIQLAQSSKIKRPISDVELKNALVRLQSQKKEIKIRRM